MAEETTQQGGAIRMAAINKMMVNIRYKVQIMARTNKLESGIMDSGVVGFMAGLIVAVIFVLAPVLLLEMV